MKKIDFNRKNILMSGASKGIGRAIAVELARQGANLFLVSRSSGPLEESREACLQAGQGNRCLVFSADISDKKQVKKAVEACQKEFTALDGIINNAGFSYPQYFDQVPLEIFEDTMKVDYLGGVYLTHTALPLLNEGGFISFTSSVVGYMGVFGYSSYAPAKFALVGLAQTLRQEMESRKISVHVLCPPDTETPGFEKENETKPFETAYLSEGAKLMSAEDVADSYLKALKKRRFMIFANFESAMLYRLSGCLPGLTHKIMAGMVKRPVK